EKAMSFYQLLTTGGEFVSLSAAAATDQRLLSSGFFNIFPDGARRFYGLMLTEDWRLVAPRVASTKGIANTIQSDENGTKYPAQPTGWPSFMPPDGPRRCWPSNGKQICTDLQDNSIKAAGQDQTPAESIPLNPIFGYGMQTLGITYGHIFLAQAYNKPAWAE